METRFGYPGIREKSEALRQKGVSPVTLVQECLDQIAKLNPTLNAFITVLADDAMKQAHRAGAEIIDGNWKGPLHGIPVAVKDFFDTKGIRTTAAFAHFKDRVPDKDAVVVEKLKKAGAIIIGKTNMHELGMGTTSLKSYFGSVHNPWNPDYVAGGSSGGSAAAVATGMCYATVDTDAVGSCRLPAACCGVVGFKPSFGRISGQGILEGEQADEAILKFSHVAITTRYADDTALVLNVLADGNENYTADNVNKPPLRIGVVRNYTGTSDIKNIFRKTVENLRKAGFVTADIDVPFQSAVFDITAIDADRASINQNLFSTVDILLLPTMADLVPTIDKAEQGGPQAVSAANTFFCNYFGLPAISIPCSTDKNGMPVGFQIVGARGGDATVLAVAATCEKITGLN